MYLRWAGALVAPGEGPSPVAGTTPVAHRLALALGAGGCVALSVLPQLVAGVLARVPLR